jgi:hypothetical protein
VNANPDRDLANALTDAFTAAREAGFVSAMKTFIVAMIAATVLALGAIEAFDLFGDANVARPLPWQVNKADAVAGDGYGAEAVEAVDADEPWVPEDGYVVDGLYVFRPLRCVDPGPRVCDEDHDAIEVSVGP